MYSVIPEDILLYDTQRGLLTHDGSSTTAEELIAAPSSLAGITSHLAKEFEMLGCTGDWNSASQSGNPMYSAQISTMLTGYIDHAAELSYQKKGACQCQEQKCTSC